LFDESGTPMVRVPRAFGDKEGAELEPFTSAYPEYGSGGAQQLHAEGATIKYDKTYVLPKK